MKQLHGLLVVDKPRGMSSRQCINRIKRLEQKKIGHAGTLDPMAQGVLLVLLGHATKISGHLLTGGMKTYLAEVEFGRTTDTWDDEGQTQDTLSTAEQKRLVDNPIPFTERLQAEIQSWIGKSQQPIPPYSAVKHEGQRLYKLARLGHDIPEKTKEIEISQAELLWVDLPRASFRVVCSSGTYIRSLAHSLGTRMNCGAVLTKLVREYSHPFSLEQAVSLQAILDNPECLHENLRPVTEALPNWSVFQLEKNDEKALRNGMPLAAERVLHVPWHTGHKAVALDSLGVPLALLEAQERQQAGINTPFWTVLRGLW